MRMVKKLTSILLVFSFTLSVTSGFASAKMRIEELHLSDFASLLCSDSTVTEVSLQNKTLSYILKDGTRASITEQSSDAGFTFFYIAEGDRSNTVAIDSTNNKIYLDGALVTITEATIYHYAPLQNDGVSPDTEWIYVGTSRYNIECETFVRSMTSGALYLLIGAALGGLAALGVTIGACGLLISAADAVNSLSKAPFVETTQYHDPSYYGYKFVYDYYYDQTYSSYTTTETNIIWT